MAVPYLKSTFKVCVDNVLEQEISGRVYNPFVPRMAEFPNIYLLIDRMERIINYLGFPQSAQDYRSFGKSKAIDGQSKGKGDFNKIMDDETFENNVDLAFKKLGQREPNHFAVRQYKKYKLAAGDVCSK